MNTKKNNLLLEINRIREMIGVSLIVEGIGDIADFFTRLGKKAVSELSDEESETLRKLIKNSTEIQRAGIRSIDDVMSDAGKQLLLKTIRENSVAVKNTFNRIVSDYAKTSMAMINSNLKSIPNLETELSKLKAGPNTALNLIQKIEKEGTENLDLLQLGALKKTLKDAKTTFEGNISMTKYLDDVSEQVDGIIKSKNVDVNINSAGTKTDGFGDEFINDPKIKNVTESQKSKIISDISSMTDEEAESIFNEVKNKTGRFSSGTLSANGLTPENIEKFGNIVTGILKIPPKIISGILTTLGFKVHINPVKAYLSLFFLSIVGYLTYQYYNGEISLSQAIPKITIDTANEDCVQNIVGYNTLTKDMKNFVAIEFGCRKTKAIDDNSTDKITGFANVGTNQVSVIYSNANCNKIYEISAGGVGSLIKNTCEESNMDGGEEENREESTGTYENNEEDFNRWLGNKGWSGIWDTELPEVTDDSGEPTLYEFKNGEWVKI